MEAAAVLGQLCDGPISLTVIRFVYFPLQHSARACGVLSAIQAALTSPLSIRSQPLEILLI